MKRLILALTVTTVATCLATATADAAGGPFVKWRGRGKPAAKVRSKASDAHVYHGFGYSHYHSVDDAYPRYIGAFHSRYFNDLGIPSGDVGIRANTVQMLPW